MWFQVTTCEICGFNYAPTVKEDQKKHKKYCRAWLRKHEAKERRSGKSQREPISKKLRFMILERDNFTCRYCGHRDTAKRSLHVDHVVPVAKGGKTEETNLVTACEDCNLGKGGRRLKNNPFRKGGKV